MNYEWQKAQDQIRNFMPLYNIPIIQPTRKRPISVSSRAKKSIISRIIHYKPTTFIGTNIMVAVMTVLVQNALNKPVKLHRDKRHDKVEHHAQQQNVRTNVLTSANVNVNTIVMPIINALTQVGTNDVNRIAYCDTCGAIIQYKNNTGDKTDINCLVCQKPLREFPSLVTQKQTVRE